jgi:hypothetical protein
MCVCVCVCVFVFVCVCLCVCVCVSRCVLLHRGAEPPSRVRGPDSIITERSQFIPQLRGPGCASGRDSSSSCDSEPVIQSPRPQCVSIRASEAASLAGPGRRSRRSQPFTVEWRGRGHHRKPSRGPAPKSFTSKTIPEASAIPQRLHIHPVCGEGSPLADLKKGSPLADLKTGPETFGRARPSNGPGTFGAGTVA